jgi:ATP-dependent helicase HrpA
MSGRRPNGRAQAWLDAVADLAAQVRYPPDLPISSEAERIIEALRNHPVVVLAGETGSGKTTQLPKMCLAAGLAAAAAGLR